MLFIKKTLEIKVVNAITMATVIIEVAESQVFMVGCEEPLMELKKINFLINQQKLELKFINKQEILMNIKSQVT